MGRRGAGCPDMSALPPSPQSVFTLGAAAGGLSAMVLNDLLGRKLSLMFSAVPSVAGYALMAGARGLWMLLLGRTLTGFAGGLTAACIPVRPGLPPLAASVCAEHRQTGLAASKSTSHWGYVCWGTSAHPTSAANFSDICPHVPSSFQLRFPKLPILFLDSHICYSIGESPH